MTTTHDSGGHLVQRKLKTKFFLFITLAIILVMAASVYLVSRNTEAQLKNLVRERLQQPLHGFKTEYKKLMDESLDKTANFASSENLLKSVKTLVGTAAESSAHPTVEAHTRAVLDEWLKTAGLDFVDLYSSEGNLLSYDTSERTIRAGYLIEKTLGFMPVPEKEEVGAFGDGKNLAIVALIPVNDAEGNTVAVLTAGYLLNDKFIDRMKQLSGLEFVLFSTKNRVRYCVSTTLWPDNEELKRINKPLVPSFFDSISGGYGELQLEKKDLSVEMIPLTTIDDTYVGEVWGGLPAGNLLNTIQSTRQVLLLIGLVAVLVFSVAGYIFTGVITSPLKALHTGIGDIVKGEYGKRIDIESNDELGALAHAFNTMTEELQRTSTELNENMSKLSAIYDVGKIMNTSSDPTEVAEMIVQILQLGFGVGSCALMLPKHGSDELVIQASAGLSTETAEKFSVVPGQGKIGEAAVTRKLLVLKEKDEYENDLASFSDKDKSTTGFVVCQPMVSGENLAGLLCVFSLDYGEMDEEKAKFFGMFASLMGPTFLYAMTVQEQETSAVNLFEALRERVEVEIERATQYAKPVTLARLVLSPGPSTTSWASDLDTIMSTVITTTRGVLSESAAVIRGSAASLYLLMPGRQVNDAKDLVEQVEDKIKANPVLSNLVVDAVLAAYPENAPKASTLIAMLEEKQGQEAAEKEAEV